MKRTLVIVLLIAQSLTGQTKDASTRQIASGPLAQIPANCAVGGIYFASDVPAGLNLYRCTATNVWSPETYAIGTTAARPATCAVGQIYFATDAIAGQNLFLCTATNVFTQLTGGGGGGGSVTLTSPNSTISISGSPGNTLTVDVGTTNAQSNNFSGGNTLNVQYLSAVFPNSSTGTTVNVPATLVAGGGTLQAQNAANGAIQDTWGITVSGAGTTGNARIALLGASVPCAFDNGTTLGDRVVVGTAGCHDAGTNVPSGTQTLGRVLSTNASAGTYAIALFPNTPIVAAGTGLVPTVSGNVETLAYDTGKILSIASFQSGVANFCSSTNGTTAYTCSFVGSGSAALTAYNKGMMVNLQTDTACSSSCSVKIEGLSAIAVKQSNGTSDPAGQLTAGPVFPVFYDGTVFRMLAGTSGGAGVQLPFTYTRTSNTVVTVGASQVLGCGDDPITLNTPAGTITLSSGGAPSGTIFYLYYDCVAQQIKLDNKNSSFSGVALSGINTGNTSATGFPATSIYRITSMTAGNVTADTFDASPFTARQATIVVPFTAVGNGLSKAVNGSSGLTTYSADLYVAGTSHVTAQTASQSTVTLATSPTVGAYRLTYYLDQNATCTTGSNTVAITLNWTDATAARVFTGATFTMGTSSGTGSYQVGAIPIYVNSGNVTYTTTVTGSCSTGGPSSYDLDVKLEKVAP